jgi:hypothetical protein
MSFKLRLCEIETMEKECLRQAANFVIALNCIAGG